MYVCHPTAITPENSDLYSSGMYVKLNAVAAGQTFHEFAKLTGTPRLTRSQMASTFSPASAACIEKKYVPNTGTKHSWFTTTRVASDRSRDEKLKLCDSQTNL